MITPRSLVVPQRVRMWIEDHQRAAAKYTNVPFALGPSGVFDLHELAAEMYAQGFHDGACVGREQARSEERARTPEEDQVIPDHLNQAREIAECAQNWGIPYALHGNAAGTPSTAPRSDEDASQVPEGGSDPARPPESHRCDLEDGMPHRWVTGIPPSPSGGVLPPNPPGFAPSSGGIIGGGSLIDASDIRSVFTPVKGISGTRIGKRITIGACSGSLRWVHHDGDQTTIELDCGTLGIGEWTLHPNSLVEVEW